MVWQDIQSISSVLDPEETWTEATNAWVLELKLGGLGVGSFVFTDIYLVVLSTDTLKSSNSCTDIYLMLWGKRFVVPYSSIQDAFVSF